MKKFIFVIIIAVMCFFGWDYYQNSIEKKDDSLTLYGNIDKRTVNLSFRFLGEITKITKDEGQKVKKGEELVFLDTSYTKNSLENAYANISAQEATLKKLKAGLRPQELKEAKARVFSAKAAYNNALLIYKRQKKLIKKGATTTQNYTDAKAQVEVTKANLNLANASYDLAKAGYRQEDIKAQEESIKALKAQAQNLELNLKNSIIKSPVNGTVLNRYYEVGSVVQATTPILQIARDDEFWVRAYIDEKNLGEIKRGDKISIKSDVRQKPYEGYIAFISSVAEFTPKNIQTQNLRVDLVYRFRVIITDADDKLKQGMPVNLSLK